MENIYLLRHAITEAHLEGRKNATLGFPDIGLNQQGIEECRKIALNLQKYEIDGILSSDLKSAQQTAIEINKYLNLPIYYMEELRERNQGEFQGVKLKEIYEENEKFSITTIGESRENLRDFMERTRAVFKRINNDFRWKSCLIISHKGFLKTMVATCFGHNPGNWFIGEMREAVYDDIIERWCISNGFRIH